LRKTAPILILIGLVLSLSAVPVCVRVAHATVFDEYLVKGTFLINFAKFVDWPASALPASKKTFTIGILGMNPFSGTLKELAEANQVQGRKVEVRCFKRLDEIQDCQMLFISVSEARNLPQIQKALNGKGLLMVSDIMGFVDRGGMIGLETEGDRIYFEINMDASHKQGLNINSNLLKLARKVVRAEL